MEAKNCPRCGKVFVQIREPICEACVKEEEEIFENVRQFVRDNPSKSIKEISEECGVSTKRILQYVRDGLLEATVGLQSEVSCSKCGKPIRTGRMCETCVLEVNFQVSDMKEASRIKNKGKVFTHQNPAK